MFTNHIYKWLETCLDYGIKENEFWNMSISELTRQVESYKRVEKKRLQEKATYDYIQANLIGLYIGRVYSSSVNILSLEEAYKGLFDDDEIQEQKKKHLEELSIIRFKQFTQQFNNNFKGGVKND